MSDVDEQAVLAEMADAQREIDEVSLARIVIDKYGADSDKPSVKLAVAHLNGAHERDRLRSELKRADRYGSERFAEAVKIQTERDTALSALATVEAERDELRVKFEAVDQEMVDICRQRLEWMKERDDALARAEVAERERDGEHLDLMRHLRVAEATADYCDNHHQRSDDPDFTQLEKVVEEWRLEQERLLNARRAAIRAGHHTQASKGARVSAMKISDDTLGILAEFGHPIDVKLMALELQVRRAADLTAEEREAIRELISYTSAALPASARIAYQGLVKLLAATAGT